MELSKPLKEAKKRVSDEWWDNTCRNEILKTGMSTTKDPDFDNKGYKVVRNICPLELLENEVPEVPGGTGMLNYHGGVDDYVYSEVEHQVQECTEDAAQQIKGEEPLPPKLPFNNTLLYDLD